MGAGEHVPLPFPGPGFPEDLVSKREFVLTEGRKGCEASSPLRLQPVQQFVSRFMAPTSPYRSLLLFHGTGVGKTCAAVQAAEMQSGTSKTTLVIVPSSIQSGFEDNVYNARRAEPGRVSEASRFQCTGSSYYSRDLEALSERALRGAQRAKARRRYEFTGPDKFANTIEAFEARARRDFGALGEEAVAKELAATIRSAYDGRLVVVDEVHELRSESGAKPSYLRLAQVLRACDGCRLILMSATPMYNRSTEIVDVVNLMRANEKMPPLAAGDLFDGDELTPAGRASLKEALAGRVSHMTYEDPSAFPAFVRPSEAGVEGAAWTPPSETMDGAPIPPGERLRKDDEGGYELFCSALSAEQERAHGRGAVGGKPMVGMQLENVCYDGGSDAANEDAFYRAMPKVPGHSGRVVRYSGGVRYFSPENVDRYAPKVGAATRLIASSTGLCFLYSNFRASGVYPVAIALEELGFLPFAGRAMLLDAPGIGAPGAPRYIVITKDEDTMSIRDRMDAINDPASGIKAVIGTETASQGLDFKRVREVHVLEPWWNMSRVRQIIGRGIRRCSHASLGPSQRNTTVYLHCTCRPGPRETMDQKIYRTAQNKHLAVAGVERLLAEAAVDCGLYRERPGKRLPAQTSSQGSTFRPRSAAPASVRCSVRWPKPGARTDESTLHPHLFKSMVDLLAFEVKEHLSGRLAATFDEIRRATGADDLVLSMSLTALMNPLESWRWLGTDRSLVYRGDLYVLVPSHMAGRSFTLVEARMGILFGSAPVPLTAT